MMDPFFKREKALINFGGTKFKEGEGVDVA